MDPVDLRKLVEFFLTDDLSSEARAQAVLKLAALLEKDRFLTVKSLEIVLTDCLNEETRESCRLAFAVMTTLFHIDVEAASEIFMKYSSAYSELAIELLQDDKVLEQLLEMLSASCADKTCRTLIEAKYTDLILKILEDNAKPDLVKALAASILIKLLVTPKKLSSAVGSTGSTSGIAAESSSYRENGPDVNELASMLRKMVVSEDKNSISFSAIEGLTYASLNISVKKMLASDLKCLKVLLSLLTKGYQKIDGDTIRTAIIPPSVTYGILTILSNICAYPPPQSEEDTQIKKLSSYATGGNGEKEFQEKSDAIAKRCKILIDLDIIKALSSCSKSCTTNSKLTIGSLLRSLATEPKHRAHILQQGAILLIMSIMDLEVNVPSSSPSQSSRSEKLLNYSAASALGKILISINPSLAFSSKISPLVTVRPLVSILDAENQTITMIDVFEALLALTNLASKDDADLSKLIVTQGWSKIEDRMLSGNTFIRRATIELLCNLVSTPDAAAKFLDPEDKASRTRLKILVAVTDAEDQKTRSAASGALAVLSEWAPAPDILIQNEDVIKGMIRIFKYEDDQDVVFRAAVCCNNIMCAVTDSSKVIKECARRAVELGAIQAMQNVLSNKADKNTCEAINLALKALQTFIK
ncbi:armadillo-type protein [Dipodascopsis uninucleata]